MKKNHFVSVAGLVINKNNEILLINNPLRDWEFPGGIVEPTETLKEALYREIFEESGVKVKILGFSGLCKNIEIDAVNIDFICEYEDGTLTTSEESIEVAWFSKEQALELVKEPLTKKRLKNMLSQDKKVYYFSFTKEPFIIVDEELFLVGM